MVDYKPLDINDNNEKIRNKKLKVKLENDTERDDYKWLMSSKRGRRMVWRLLDQAGVFRLSFNTNAMQMAFNEGNRNGGNRILDLIQQYCFEMYPQMLKENVDGGRDDNTGTSHNDQ